MESNFIFLRKKYPKLYRMASFAENYLFSDPNGCVFKIGAVLEGLVEVVCEKEGMTFNPYTTYNEKLKTLRRGGKITEPVFQRLDYVRNSRNPAVHQGVESLDKAKNCLKYSFDVACWFNKKYENHDFSFPDFVIPNQNKSEIDNINNLLKQLESRLENLESERQKKENQDIVITPKSETIEKVDDNRDLGVRIEDLDLSVRSINCLHSLGVSYASQMVTLTDDEIFDCPNLGKKSILELFLRIYQIKNNPEEFGLQDKDDYFRYKEDYKEDIRKYCENYDISFVSSDLSGKTISVLQKNSVNRLSEIICMNTVDLMTLEGLGLKSFDELRKFVDLYYVEHKEAMLTFISRSGSRKGAVQKQIINVFNTMDPFESISANSIVDSFSSDDKFTVMATLQEMVNNKKLELVDGKYSKYKPSLDDYISQLNLTEREVDILERRLKGLTLEETGEKYSLTRERVRQIEDKILSKFSDIVLKEDKYQYLYTRYDLSKELFTDYLNENEKTYYYLRLRYSAGKEDVAECINDPEVRLEKYNGLEKYIEKDLITVDGVKLPAKKLALELYVLKTCFNKPVRFDDFVKTYKVFLKQHGLDTNNALNYDGANLKSRENALARSNCVLCSDHKSIRYYQATDYDFTELFDTIGLDSFTRNQYSTLKWFNDYPELMRKYNIHNGYELHNLINKFYKGNNLINITRMPYVSFGNFDMEKMMEEELRLVAPIQKREFAQHLNQKYGYSVATLLGGDIKHVSKFDKNGILFIDEEEMNDEELHDFVSILDDDLYTFDELYVLFNNLFPQGNLSKLNKYNLLKLGFKATDSYVYRNHSSASEYFRKQLTRDEIVDISELRKRFGNLGPFNNTYSSLKSNYEVVEYKPNILVSLSYLAQFGIDKKDLTDFANEVAEEIKGDKYFTMRYLTINGLTDNIKGIDLGEYFYSSVLAADNRFKTITFNGVPVLCKTEAVISRTGFLSKLLKDEKDEDLRSILSQEYGIDISQSKLNEIISRKS